ncbi:MAG TPA: SBBP repeat-containing protein, partial [Chthoniobacterales bacterium]|nr:SBBP repeat-containing protein [Chthoniobacterales bacterium]
MIDRLNHSALLFLVFGLGLDPVRGHAESHAPATKAPEMSSSLFSSQPLHFEQNRGQAESPARFLARGVNYNFLISPIEAQLILHKTVESPVPVSREPDGRPASPPRTLRMQFIGANPEASLCGHAEMPGKINYLVGNDPSQWRVGIPTYARIHAEELYPGINLVYYGNQQQLEYDLIVSPGADPAAITIHFEGADNVSINQQGELVLKLGPDEIRQPRPSLFQVINGVTQSIPGQYQLRGCDSVIFSVGQYDHHLPLRIDPLLTYSSYFGGKGADVAVSVKVDASNDVYVAGVTLSQLSLTNPPQASLVSDFQGGRFVGDGFIAKFDSTLTNLLFLTYFGGSLEDAIYDLALDGSNNIYVTGFTDSTNFPIM